MVRAKIKTETEIGQFRQLQEKLQSLRVAKQQEEVHYGDAPDEFKGQKHFKNNFFIFNWDLFEFSLSERPLLGHYVFSLCF